MTETDGDGRAPGAAWRQQEPVESAESSAGEASAGGFDPVVPAASDYLALFVTADVRLPRAEQADAEFLQFSSDIPDPAAVRGAAATLVGEDPDVLEFLYRPGDNHLLVGVVTTPLLPLGAQDATSPETLWSDTTSLLSLAGVDLRQAEQVVSTLQAVGGPTDVPETVRPVFKKVYVSRRILGLPVAGDYFVATFDLDGSFRKLIGTWRQINYSSSFLSTTLSEPDLLSLVADRLAAARVPLRDTVYAIDVRTFYCANPSVTDGEWEIRLCASAAVRDSNGNGLGDEGKIPTYQFVVNGDISG